MAKPTPTDTGALSGYRVLELGTTIAGPFCGRLLADFGADVIKVEGPDGDPIRSSGVRYHGKSLYAASILRNKALICIDLRKPDGQALIARLAADCDVVIENFRPGMMESWNLGYETLARANPGLVMVRISGFGQTGPYSTKPGYGVTSEAMSGLRQLTGDPDRPPARVAIALTDYITGLYGAFGATLALLKRQRTGRGQCIDTALYECAFSFTEPYVPAYEKLGFVAKRAGSAIPGSAPNNLFATADGQFIHIQGAQQNVFKRLVRVMGQPDLLEDPRFATAMDRNSHQQEIDDYVSKWTTARTLPEVEKALDEGGVPAMRIFTIADIFGDPHYRARGMVVDAPDDELGTVALAAPVPRLSETPGRIRSSGGGQIGRDTRRVLRDSLQLSDAQIDELAAAGAVVCASQERRGAE